MPSRAAPLGKDENHDRRYAWVVLIIATLAVFAAIGLGRFGYTMLLPSMQTQLNLNNAQSGALAAANILGYLALAVGGGALGARFGPRAVIVAGMVVTGVGMVLTGLAGGFLSAVVFRVLTGMGSGATYVPVMALLPAWFAPRRRGLASGIAVGGSSLGLIIIGPLVPRVIALYAEEGWRVSWYIFGGATLAIALLAFFFVFNSPGEKGARSARRVGAERGRPQPVAGWSGVYRSLPVLHLGLIYLGYGFAFYVFMTFFTKHLMAGAGYSREAAGTLFMLMGWLSLPCTVLWGWISDHTGRRASLLVVLLAQALALGLFGLGSDRVSLTISALVFGLSAWSIPAIVAAMCGDMLTPRLASAALGYLTMFFCLGTAIGPSVAGWLADRSGSFHAAYLMAAAVAVLAAAAVPVLRPMSTGLPDLASDASP